MQSGIRSKSIDKSRAHVWTACVQVHNTRKVKNDNTVMAFVKRLAVTYLPAHYGEFTRFTVKGLLCILVGWPVGRAGCLCCIHLQVECYIIVCFLA